LTGESAGLVVDRFFRIIKSFSTGTRESLYANIISMIIVKLAAETETIKARYNKNMSQAYETANNARISITKKESLAHVIVGVVRLILIGGAISGAGVVLTIAILLGLSVAGISVPMLEGDFGRNAATWASIAFTLAFMGIGLCWRVKRNDRKIKKITDDYRAATEKAKATFKRDIGRLYESALNAANNAYFKCVGYYPTGNGRRHKELFVNLVYSVVESVDEATLSQIESEVPFDIPEKHIVKKLIAVVVRLYKRVKQRAVGFFEKCHLKYQTHREHHRRAKKAGW
jgi:hypothetical protein